MNQDESSDELQIQQPQYGMTMWDAGHGVLRSKMIFYTIWAVIGSVLLWLFWDTITSIPVYVISSVLLSMFWYSPISQWLSRQSSYVEVWCPLTNTLTTYRIGRNKMRDLRREGVMNQITSLTGNSRIFASHLDLEQNYLETTWVHGCEPWVYHTERRTLVKLTDRVNSVLDDIVNQDAMAQVLGRTHAMESMRRHYSDLDRIFHGETEVPPLQEMKSYDDMETPES